MPDELFVRRKYLLIDAKCFFKYGSVKESEEAFRKGTSLDSRSPLNTQGYRVMAAMRQGCGDHGAAVKLLTTGLTICDAEQRIECLFLRGACQHAMGYHEKAISDYDAALMANHVTSNEVAECSRARVVYMYACMCACVFVRVCVCVCVCVCVMCLYVYSSCVCVCVSKQ
jgi:tetratricopeptide (TPR) repeat protein